MMRPRPRWEKLEAVLARAASRDEDVALLADLLSLPASEGHPLPSLSPQHKKDRTLEALTGQLEGLARRQPVVTVFEGPDRRRLSDRYFLLALAVPRQHRAWPPGRDRRVGRQPERI